MSQEVESFIELFNKCWIKGKFNILTDLLDNKIIFIAPDLITEIKGKDNCIQTIKDFSKNAETKTFEVTNQKINIWDNTAVVVLDYYIEYEMNKQLYKEKGKEFWTLNKHNNNWRLVWRAIVKNEKI
ncbi:MAG: hypothetical protein Kow0079_06330 [Vicingaceae bacterium]